MSSPKPFNLPLLPPKLDISKHISLVVGANKAIARYDEAQCRLPNPSIIVMPLASLEAQRSSSVEGTQATYDDFLAGEDNPDTSTDKGKDIQEIKNYRDAILASKKLLKNRPLSENVIKDLNRILLNSVRGANRSPGEFRRHQVHIGKPGSTVDEATYIPPIHTAIPDLFSNLVNYIQDDAQPDRLVQAAVMHYQFEAIHPFSDGNGRTGRIMVPVYLYEKGITSEPNMYISEFIDKYRRDYYETLQGVSRYNDWDSWIEFFLRALREQAKLLKFRIDQVNDLYMKYHSQIDNFSSKYAPLFLDAIFQKQTITASNILDMTRIPAASVYILIEKFVEKGVIKETGLTSRRQRQYNFTELTKIVEGLTDPS